MYNIILTYYLLLYLLLCQYVQLYMMISLTFKIERLFKVKFQLIICKTELVAAMFVFELGWNQKVISCRHTSSDPFDSINKSVQCFMKYLTKK